MLSVPHVGTSPLVPGGLGGIGQVSPETGELDFLSYFLGLQADPLATITDEQNVAASAAADNLLAVDSDAGAKSERKLSAKDQSLIDGLFVNPQITQVAPNVKWEPDQLTLPAEKAILPSAWAKKDLSSDSTQPGILPGQSIPGNEKQSLGSADLVDAWGRMENNRVGAAGKAQPDQAVNAYANLGKMVDNGEASVGPRGLTDASQQISHTTERRLESSSEGTKSKRSKLGEPISLSSFEGKRGHSLELTTGLQELTGLVAAKSTAAAQGSHSVSGQNEPRSEGSIPDLMDRVESLAYRGGGKMVVKLSPPHLGEVQVQVTAHGNRVEIEMTSENSTAKSLLESSLNDLVQSIESQDLVVSRMEVQVGQEADFSQNQQQPSGFAFGENYRQPGDSHYQPEDRKPWAEQDSSRFSTNSRMGNPIAETRTASGRLGTGLVDLKV